MSRAGQFRRMIIVASVTLLFGGSSFAEEKPQSPEPKSKPPQTKVEPLKKAGSKMSPDREQAVKEFATRNHPELVPLLENLKSAAPSEYAAAIADLNRTVDRLEKVKDKSPARYEIQLEDWRLTSRIRLLAARLSVAKDPQSADAELRAAVSERFELRLATRRADLEQLKTRVAKLSASIEELSSKKDETIEKELTQLKATRPAAKPTVKKAKVPAAEQIDVKAGDQK